MNNDNLFYFIFYFSFIYFPPPSISNHYHQHATATATVHHHHPTLCHTQPTAPPVQTNMHFKSHTPQPGKKKAHFHGWFSIPFDSLMCPLFSSLVAFWPSTHTPSNLSPISIAQLPTTCTSPLFSLSRALNCDWVVPCGQNVSFHFSNSCY